jgi:tetratricopeptide (TPR) repeat protein
MKVADLLFALNELRAGRVSVDQLIAACSAWSNEPTRPLAEFLKPGAGLPPPAPLAEPASGVLDSFLNYRPTAPRRPATAGGGGINRNLVLIAGGVGLVLLLGMAVAVGYLATTNSRLEAHVDQLNAELEVANKDLERARVDLAKSEPNPLKRWPTNPSSDPPREAKATVKADPGRESATSTPAPKAGELSKSVQALADALARIHQSAGPDDPRTVRAAADLGRALVDAGRPSEAIPLLEDVDRRAVKEPWARAAAVALAHAFWATGQADKAVEVCERVRDELPDNDPLVPDARLQAALAYRAAGKWDRAKPLFLDHLVFARKENNDRQAGEALAWMGECLLRSGDTAGAEPLVRECVDLSTRQAADWSAFAAKSLLGEVLLAQKKPEQAEPLMTQGYDGLKARKEAIPWDRRDALPNAAGRLARLYEATGDKDKAAEWKKVEENERGSK